MATSYPSSETDFPKPSRIPPLEPGDHLTRDEFERRFDATPGLKKAELINGVVYMPPPVSFSWHSKPHAAISTLLTVYQASTPQVESGVDGSVRFSDASHMPQPDGFLFVDPAAGGQARVGADGYIEGTPELIVEVAASTVSFDLHDKRDLYERFGVREYIVWRTHDRCIDQFRLIAGSFLLEQGTGDGIIRSVVFPGLWLDAKSLIAGDLERAINVVQEGIRSPEHAAFIADLKSYAERSR